MRFHAAVAVPDLLNGTHNVCTNVNQARVTRRSFAAGSTSLVSHSQVGNRGCGQYASLAPAVLLGVDLCCDWVEPDSALHLAVENQRLDAALGRLGRRQVRRRAMRPKHRAGAPLDSGGVGLRHCPRDCPCKRQRRALKSQRQPSRPIGDVVKREGFTRKNEDGREAGRRLANRRVSLWATSPRVCKYT